MRDSKNERYTKCIAMSCACSRVDLDLFIPLRFVLNQYMKVSIKQVSPTSSAGLSVTRPKHGRVAVNGAAVIDFRGQTVTA